MLPAVLDFNQFTLATGGGYRDLASHFLATHKETGAEVRVTELGSDHQDLLARSLAIQSQIDLPTMPQLIGFATKGERSIAAIVTAVGGRLQFQELLRRFRDGTIPYRVGATMISKVIFGLVATMAHLHRLNIAYRDFKPDHIFVNDKGEPSIVDFSCAFVCEEPDEVLDSVGSLGFVAPEVYFHCQRIASDIYSFSMFLFRIFAEKPTIRGALYRERHVSRLDSLNDPNLIVGGERLDRAPGISDAFWDLITRCWRQDPDERPSFSDTMEMMLESDDLTLPETDLEDYHDYQAQMMRYVGKALKGNTKEVVNLMKSAGVRVDFVYGFPP
jgi:serine/threonine protein kinase